MHKLGAWETDISILWETELSVLRHFFPNGDFNEMPCLKNRNAQSFLINEAAFALLSIGKSFEADSLYCMSIQIVEEDCDWQNASAGYQNLTDLRIGTGDLEGAKESAEKALNMAISANNNHYQIDASSYLAYCRFLADETEESLTLFNEANNILKDSDPKSSGLYSLAGIFFAETLLRAGKPERALEVTTNNLKTCERNLWPADISRTLRLLGAIKRGQGSYAEAGDNLEKALDIARNIGRLDIEMEILIERARLGAAIYGKDEINLDLKTTSNIESALQICESTGFKRYSPEAKVALAEYYEKTGDDRAKELAEEGRDEAQAMGYHWPVVDAENLLYRLKG
jgi:tetratricopeptide (TPR) repeat protein